MVNYLSFHKVYKKGRQDMMATDWKVANNGAKLPDKVVIWTLREMETYKYLEILEVDTLKQVEMKEKI